MELYTPAPLTPTQSEILDIQQALWDNNVMRSAGNADVTIAAYAIKNDLTVLCSDHDFEHIAKVLGPGVLKVEYLAE
ncbi:putative nuclease of putative toxin-antitoxin system [Glaciihabitans sp. UYNi722]